MFTVLYFQLTLIISYNTKYNIKIEFFKCCLSPLKTQGSSVWEWGESVGQELLKCHRANWSPGVLRSASFLGLWVERDFQSAPSGNQEWDGSHPWLYPDFFARRILYKLGFGQESSPKRVETWRAGEGPSQQGKMAGLLWSSYQIMPMQRQTDCRSRHLQKQWAKGPKAQWQGQILPQAAITWPPLFQCYHSLYPDSIWRR